MASVRVASLSGSLVQAISLVLAIAIWLYSIPMWSMGSLNLTQTPFMSAPALFWIALAIAVGNLFLSKTPRLQWFSVGVVFLLSTITLSLIEPFGRMHDSAINLRDSTAVLSGDLTPAYGGDFPLAYIYMGILQSLFPLGPWQWSRAMIPMTVALHSVLGVAFVRRLRSTQLREGGENGPDITAVSFLAFFALFGWVAQLRVNAAPQTFGFILFWVLLLLTARSPRHPLFFALYTLVYFSLLLTHPLSAILVIPGLLAVVYHRNAAERRTQSSLRSLLRAGISGEVVLAIVIFWAWILYRAQGTLSYAVSLYNRVLSADRLVLTVTSNAPAASTFASLNVVFIILLAVTIAVFLILGRRDKVVRTSLLWGGLLLPLGMALFGAPFFSRILLFGSIPLGLVFAAGIRRVKALPRTLRRPALSILIVLALLGVMVSYYHDSALDRSTLTEIRAFDFTFTRGDGEVWVDGMFVPFDEHGKPLPERPLARGPRVGFSYLDVAQSDLVIVTQQLLHYAAVGEGAQISETSLVGIVTRLDQTGRVYDNGFSMVFQTA